MSAGKNRHGPTARTPGARGQVSRLLFLLLAFPTILGAQSLSGPESIDYDAAADRHLISNKTAGQILARAADGTLSVFTNDPTSPAGLEIVGNLVYVADATRIRAYRLADAVRVVDYPVAGSAFLNGLSSNGSDRLWVTDFSAQRLHELDISDVGNITHATPLPATGFTPNGLWYDAPNGRLLIVSWGSNARIFEWRTGDAAAALLSTSSSSNFDGVVVDCDGRLYVSSWGAQAILTTPPPFGPASVFSVFAPGLSNPADLGYASGVVASANAGSNTVTFHATACVGVLFRDQFETR